MSADYNPNAIWTSKKKKYEYKPPETARPVKPPAGPPDKSGSGPSPISPQASPKKKVVLWSLIGLAIVLAGAGIWYFVMRPPAALNVAISFSNPSQVLVGDPFIIAASYENNSATILRNASLSVTLPDGISFEGQPLDQRVMQWSLGDIPGGATSNQSSSLIVIGNPNSVQHITAKLTYNTDVSKNVQFEADGQSNLVVAGTAIGLTITAPPSVFSGQNFNVAVAYVNNAGHPLGDVKVAMQYPPGFTFEGSSAPSSSLASAANDVWDLGPLATNATGSFMITGNVTGADNALFPISGTASVELSGQTYAVVNPNVSVTLSPSPLQITGLLNNSSSYVSGLADSLGYTFSYTNNSNVTLLNAVLTAKFTGTMFDFTSLRSNGSFSSLTNTVTWTGANTPGLASIAPGQSGTVSVDVRTKGSFPIRLPSDKDYLLKAHAVIQSPTVPPGTAASSTISVLDMQNKVGGVTNLAAVGYYDDPTSGILNAGPYPPKVDQKTEYTIHWRVTTYSTDIANVTVSAYLQSGTTCTGDVKSNVSSAPTCDPSTGLVSWTVPSIPATTGVLGPPAEAVFQVENTPAVNEVGQDVVLLGPTSLQASDEFTSSTVQATAAAVATNLPNDTSVSQLQSRQVSQ